MQQLAKEAHTQERCVKLVNEEHKYGNTHDACYQHGLEYNDTVEFQLKIYHHCFWKTITETLQRHCKVTVLT